MTKAPALDLSALASGVKESTPIERKRETESKFANNPFVAVLKNSNGKAMELPAVDSTDAAKELQSYLRDAAEKNGLGLSTSISANGKKFVVKFQGKAKRKNGGITTCPVCGEEVTVTGDKKVRIHGPRDARCEGSGKALEEKVETPAPEATPESETPTE